VIAERPHDRLINRKGWLRGEENSGQNDKATFHH
jgi:hypothetical protein